MQTEIPIPSSKSQINRPRAKRNMHALLALLLLGLSGIQLVQAQQITNEFIRVNYNAGNLTFTHNASGKVFGEYTRPAVGSPTVSQIADPHFGSGNRLEFSTSDGHTDRLTLYSGIQFVMLQRVLNNNSGTNTTYNIVTMPEIGMGDVFNGVASISRLGSKALNYYDYKLTSDEGTKGSYHFLAAADPATRNGVVGTWLTHNRGSGIVGYYKNNNVPTMQHRIDYGRLIVKAGASEASETFLYGYFDDARIGLERSAEASATYYQVNLRPKVNGYCTWYAEKNNGAASEAVLPELSTFIKNKLAPYEFDFVQIDDRWQAETASTDGKTTPDKNFSTVKPNGPYPSGMKLAADGLNADNLTAGIWFLPFGGDVHDAYFADKQDWFARDDQGVAPYSGFAAETLDLTHPDAQDFIKDMADTISNTWGYKYFKMDGLYSGMAVKEMYVSDGYNGRDTIGQLNVHNPDITPVEAFRIGFSKLREGASSDTFFLGCNTAQNMRVLGASFGFVDAMRIGADREYHDTPIKNGTDNMSRFKRGLWNGTQRYFLNGRMWWNDPDPIYTYTGQPKEAAILTASWVAMADALKVPGNWLPDLPEDRLEILRRTLPSRPGIARPVDYFENDDANIWLWQHEEGATQGVVGLYSYDAYNVTPINYDMTKLGLDASTTYVGFNYWENTFVQPFSGSLVASIPAAACKIISLRPQASHPVVVSTSTHMLRSKEQILAETWNASANTLSGQQYMVANDPCEIRIVAPSAGTWNITASSAQGPGTATTSVSQNGNEIRMTITPTATGLYTWSATFGALANPVAAMSAHVPTGSYAPATILLDGSGSVASQGETITLFSWDVNNDGTNEYTSVNSQQNHSFAAGIHTIKLTVTDSASKSASTTTSITISAPPAAPQDAVAYWPMDETSGSVATDASGNNINGTYHSVALPSPGVVGTAAGFTTSTSFMEANHASLAVSGTQVTYVAWIKPLSYVSGKWAGLFGTHNEGAGLGIKNNLLQFTQISKKDADKPLDEIPTNTWTHIACSYDDSSSANNLNYYINGTLVKTVSFEAHTDNGGNLVSNPILWLGRFGYSDTYFDGYMDDVYVFNRILSTNEVAAIHNLGVSPPTFANWAVSSGLSGGLQADPYADSDSDGVADFTEYALNMNPSADDASQLGSFIIAASGEGTYTFLKPIQNVTYAVEYSTNLTHWTTYTGTQSDIGTEKSVTIPAGFGGGNQLYLRLRLAQ